MTAPGPKILHRYRLRAARRASHWDLTIVDIERGMSFCRWSEPVTSPLIKRFGNDQLTLKHGRGLSKQQLKDLLLVATRYQLLRQQHPQTTANSLLNKLQQYPGRHFLQEDIAAILESDGISFSIESLERHLAALVAAGNLARIEVTPNSVFYDCDTSPHAHLYDPVNRELRDLDVSQLAVAATLFIEWPYGATQQR